VRAAILPGLPWHQVAGWLAASAVVIVPSLAETFGLVALEAMAGGTPVIAFDVDHLPALIGGGGSIVAREHGHVGLIRAGPRPPIGSWSPPAPGRYSARAPGLVATS